ncbi:MAG TPA: protein-L-isoaspartate(D-aspartate) O-methyltransferase [Caulobacterales bacterium]|nr:protein-L-isoaspartate(D-aspartate) O-methyltransferase [Caulobacterales bacterium]
MAEDPARLMRFILELRQEGVTHARVLAAMERTPRSHYAPAHMEGLVFDDIALPLPHGQSMTKPATVARMLAALDPQPDDAVLEIGTGSGYQAAVLSLLARKVVTLDRWSDLVADARQKFGTARLMNVFAHVADGAKGWADDAPYHRIVVAGEVDEAPQALFEQLTPDGVLVAATAHRLVRWRNGTREDLGPAELPAFQEGLGEG